MTADGFEHETFRSGSDRPTTRPPSPLQLKALNCVYIDIFCGVRLDGTVAKCCWVPACRNPIS
jgi:hypothetical protein